jgi:putative ABC transport system ATP-binding protein
MILLSAKTLSHQYDYPLFQNVSLDIAAGESVAIIGVSGSGKSTLLHILSTLLQPDGGSVELLGKRVDTLKPKELVAMRRHELGMIFQSHYLFKGFSAYENLEVSALLSNETIDDTLLERLNVQHVLKQKVTELSGGQQQRISIARVLTKKPRIIFADEPTGNLDHDTADEVMKLFHTYVAEHQAAMVLVTHDEALASVCTRVYRLENETLLHVK